MKKLVTGSFILLSTFGACQESSKKISQHQDEVKRTESDMLDIYKQVKASKNNTWYEIEFSQDACGYEILINDLPVHRYFMYGSVNQQRIQINDQILGTGKQSITVRLFAPQLNDKSYAAGLIDASKFSIKVLRRASEASITDAEPVFEFTTPTKPGTSDFLGSGQKVYEFKGTFDVTVPYVLEGWRSAQDLSKENQADLLNQAVAACEKFRKILVDKDVNAYATLMYDKEVELAKSYYWATPEDSRSRWEEMKATVLEKREILPIKDYKMVLYAGGKILSLQPTNELYRDYLSIIRAQTPDEDIQVSFFLYKKLGSNELTPIR